MANMGYVRFQNTVRDMEDCVEHIEDDLRSEEEQDARREFISICLRVAAEYGELAES